MSMSGNNMVSHPHPLSQFFLLHTLLLCSLYREIENGRMVRLLTKLNTVVDRAEFNLDMAWSETGDR